MKSAASPNIEQELREMNEALLISSVHQHELTEQAQKAETALRESERRLAAELAATRALHDISTQLIQEGDAKSLYEHALDAAVTIMRSDMGSIQILDEPEDSLRLLAFRGFEPDFGKVFELVRLNTNTSCSFARRVGHRIVVPDVEKCDFIVGTKALEVHRKLGIRAVQSTPLISRSGRLLGMISTHWRTAHEPLESDLRQFDILARQAADLIERNQVEQKLREGEERYRTLFDSMDEGYCIIEMIFDENDRPVDYRFLQVNRAFEVQSGMHDVTGRRMLEFVSSVEEHWLENYGRVALTGEPIRFANEYKSLRRWFDVFAFRVGLPESRRVAVLFSDITGRKESDSALDAARDEAEVANRAKDMFLATLSHEMRTPLSAIVGWMSILEGGTEGGCTDTELNEGLDVVKRNARTMVELLDDVMDVSRIVSGKLRLEVRPNELIAIIRAGIDVVRSAADAKGIAISTDFDPAASGSTCDAARMQQVVWNLLSNAIKFTPKGGKIRVTLARDRTDARIQVIDSGPGISPDLLPYVFDRFRQADSSTRRKFGGLGLGLSIVKQLAELHGGTVEADSPGEGLGSTFTVTLPIRAVNMEDSDDEMEAEDKQQSATAVISSVHLDGLRVLVVDDEADARRLLIMVLQQAGAVVTEASSAADALAALPTVNPEILISDLGMPDRDGFDLIRQIRAQGYHARDLPAVALSAFIRKEDQRQALLAGFQIHLAKPVDPRDLTAAIASLAGRT